MKTEVKIGNQVWMSENLNVDRFRNGDPILEAKTNEEWQIAGENKQAAWCYYDNNPVNGAIYGKLYNWYAVIDPRGLAPEGWQIPGNNEWTKLADVSGKEYTIFGGSKIVGAKMKSNSGWANNGNGNNETGFSGLPGGNRFIDGTFYDLGGCGFWWSSSEASTKGALARALAFDDETFHLLQIIKCNGFSVRCFRVLFI
jgi:uncharacterized protein (TIGR02145 family)